MVQLICVFSNPGSLENTLQTINETYDVLSKKVFVLSIEDSEELVCSFNVDKSIHVRPVPGALLVHRKKETNTIYTINSLNELIKHKNNGVLDTKYVVNWEEYRNCMLVTSSKQLRVLKTKIFQVKNFG